MARQLCIRCHEARADGRRNPSKWCGDRCRNKAHRERLQWHARYEARAGSAAPDLTVAAIAMALTLKVHAFASEAHLLDAVEAWGMNRSDGETVLRQLVEDGALRCIAGLCFLDRKLLALGERHGGVLRERQAALRAEDLQRGASVGVVATIPERGSESAKGHSSRCNGFVAVAGRRRCVPAGTKPCVAPPAGSAPPEARLCAPAPSSARPTPKTYDSILNISPPRPDGGTALRCKTDPEAWPQNVAALMPRTLRARDLPPSIQLPTPTGGTMTAAVKRRPGGGGISLLFYGQAQVDLDPTGMVYLEADKEGLWSQGTKEWLEEWLDRVSIWFLRTECPEVSGARALGWSTWKLELAADFVGLQFFSNDPQKFVGRSKASRKDSGDYRPDDTVETIDCGQRRPHCLSVSTHDKSQWFVRKKLTVETSVYYPTWGAHGYSGGRIRRVEARASGDALDLRPRKGTPAGATVPGLDMRDPATLVDPAALGRFWRHATRKYRLADMSEGTHSAKLRALPTDPRWLAVQAVGGADDGIQYAAVERATARRMSHEDLLERAKRDLWRAQTRIRQLNERQAPSNVILFPVSRSAAARGHANTETSSG